MAKDFDYYFAQLRRIEDHREQDAEKEIRKLYKQLLKETKEFVSEEYYKLAQDGKLTFEILRSKGRDARFLEEVEQKLKGVPPKVSKEIRDTVNTLYQMAYDGMIDAVNNSNTPDELKANLGGLKGISAETVKASVKNPIMDIALEKNHKDVLWDIKREIAVGLTMGDRYETMARRISEKLDRSYKKAILISRTEAGRVREAGHLASAKRINDKLVQGESGVQMTKTWKTMRDGVVRDHHRSMNGKVALMDEAFELPDGIKTQAPKQSGAAKHDCNCRCFVKYALMDDEQFFKATGQHFAGYDVNVMEVFKSNGEYINKNGEFDIDAATSDYTKFLETVPEKNRAVLEYAFQNTPFVETTNKNVVFAYSNSRESVVYNSRSNVFRSLQFNVAVTHELAHRIDDMFQLTVENAELTKAIHNAKKTLKGSIQKFVKYSWDKDEDGFVSDVFSAISGENVFFAGHDAEYWENDGKREAEIYANIFSLEAIGDQEKIKYLRKNFPDIMNVYDHMEFEV